ncbi:BPSS1780 family membrane protein [Paraburkholderia caffeinilytica]|uniref:BPSS1780 family membrane protein n=1 Tax=Paraburkholderia caffeinilytica TaxID=1761016 RepID=UPI003DA0645E
MNMHYSGGTAVPARPQPASWLRYPDSRVVGVQSVGGWLAEGMRIARANPVLWFVAILGCADLVTLFELAPPLRVLAVLVGPVLAAGLVLMQERASNARPWSIRETIEAVNVHRNALITIGQCGAAVAYAGHLIAFVAFHVSMRTSVASNGVHDLTIVYGAHNGTGNALEPVLNLLAYAVAASLVWFAPALVVLNNVSPLNAMAASLRAVARNWRVASVFGIAIAVDVWLATFAPLLLRGLLVTPLVSALIVLSMYGGYRGIFTKS